MILLWLALLVSSVHSNSFIGHIANYTEYYNYCITKGTENRTSWLVAIHNLDTGKHFNGALISDRHLLTIKDAVTSIQDGVERVTSDFANRIDLQAVTDDHKLVTLKAKHIVIPVDANGKTEEIRLHDLAIVELDSPVPDGVNFVCPNGRYFNTPNYPPCKGTEWKVDDECNRWFEGYRFSTYTRTFTDNSTWGGYNVPFPDHSNFTGICGHFALCNELFPIMHNNLNQSEGGEEGRAGDVFVSGSLSHWNDTLHGLTVDQIGFAQLHGLGINKTSIINLNYWELFICEHTGVCFLGMFSPNDPNGDHDELVKDAVFLNEHHPYLFDGALVLKRCTTEHTRQKENVSAKSIEKPNRLKASEYIETNCGHKEDHEEWPVRIFRPSVHLNGSEPVHICTGSFISRRHVITAKSCLIPHLHRRLSVQYGPMEEGWQWKYVPSFAARILNHKKEYYTADVRFVIYAGEIGPGSGSDKDIAVLELTENITTTTTNSMVMCLPGRGKWALNHWHMKQYEHGRFGISDDFFTMQWHGYGNRNESVTARLFEFDDLLKSTVKSKYEHTDIGSPLVKSYFSNADEESCKDSNTTTLWAITTDPMASPFLIYAQNNIGLVCRMSGVCPDGANDLRRNEEMDIYANGQILTDCV